MAANKKTGKYPVDRRLAEAHGNRTHPRGSSPRAPDLKSGRATSALSASVITVIKSAAPLVKHEHLPKILLYFVDMDKFIEIKGLKEHNLHIEELQLPLNKLIGLTGPSGSGKSTFGRALFLEGRRLYLESLGLNKMAELSAAKRPKADSIKGLPPAIYLEQMPEQAVMRTTLGQMTDIETFLRILFSVAGTPFCPECGVPIEPSGMASMVSRLTALPEGTRYALMIPNPGLKPHELQKEGFIRIEKDGSFFLLDDLDLPDQELNQVNIVIDRIVARPGISSRIEDALRLAASKGNGIVRVAVLAEDSSQSVSHYLNFTTRMTCPECMSQFPMVEPGLFSSSSAAGQCHYCSGKGCKKCHQTGLSDFVRNVTIEGIAYHLMIGMRVEELDGVLKGLGKRGENDQKIAPVLNVLEKYLSTIKGCGLAYLELTRPVATLSRGELQKLRIAIQIHRGLSGCLIVLDEPTVGLHIKDMAGLNYLLKQLKDAGNSVIVIEHDVRVLRWLDWIVELGPGGGVEGGQICFNGPAEEFFNRKIPQSGLEKTARASAGLQYSPEPKEGPRRKLEIAGLCVNNLKNTYLSVPLGRFITVTGPAGSGKSTLVHEGMVPKLKEEGLRVHILDQSPLRGSTNSIVATYLGVFTAIRKLFGRARDARARGLGPSAFSLSRPGGRCEECKGLGSIYLDIKYLPPVEMVCPVCSGRRYMPDVLGCLYKGKNMFEVLCMTIDEAVDFFVRIKKVRELLLSASQAGVGYLTLGQPTSKLSGGERMRLRLAELLVNTISALESGMDRYCVVLDEPTAGLHPKDVQMLLSRLKALSGQGITVVVIDDDEQILSHADWLIEMGPGGGPDGGQVIKNGPPG